MSKADLLKAKEDEVSQLLVQPRNIRPLGGGGGGGFLSVPSWAARFGVGGWGWGCCRMPGRKIASGLRHRWRTCDSRRARAHARTHARTLARSHLHIHSHGAFVHAQCVRIHKRGVNTNIHI